MNRLITAMAWAGLLPVVAAAASNAVVMSPAVLYDRHPTWVGEEAGIWCADPAGPQRLIGVTNANEDPGVGNMSRTLIDIKMSDDGGKTWARTLHSSADPRAWDPTCAYGVDGTAFVAVMTGYKGGLVWRSADGGRAWSQPQKIPYPRVWDRPFLAVDHGQSRWRGRLYLVGAGMDIDRSSHHDEIAIYVSDDAGRTLQGPTSIPLPYTGSFKGVTHLGQAAVLSDGTLMVSWTEAYFGHGTKWPHLSPCALQDTTGRDEYPCGTSVIKVARSLDGGRTFETPIVVARGQHEVLTETERFVVAKWYPTLAIDTTHGAYKDSAYIAWSDAANGRQQILFSRSEDRGVTWMAPRIISDDQAFDESKPIRGPHNAMVNLAVNKGGVLGVMYYAQTKVAPGPEFWSVFATSDDGGRSWSSYKRVTAAPLAYDGFSEAWDIGFDDDGLGEFSAGKIFVRFPNYGQMPTCLYGLTSDANGGFRLFAFSNPTGQPQFDAFVAQPTQPAVLRHESGSAVAVRAEKWNYDRTNNTIEASFRVENISGKPLRLPIRLVAEVPSSRPGDTGSIEFLNADNARRATQAWWDFGVGSSVLQQGERTAPRQILINFTRKTGGERTELAGHPVLNFSFTPLLLRADP